VRSVAAHCLVPWRPCREPAGSAPHHRRGLPARRTGPASQPGHGPNRTAAWRTPPPPPHPCAPLTLHTDSSEAAATRPTRYTSSGCSHAPAAELEHAPPAPADGPRGAGRWPSTRRGWPSSRPCPPATRRPRSPSPPPAAAAPRPPPRRHPPAPEPAAGGTRGRQSCEAAAAAGSDGRRQPGRPKGGGQV
jgi:hypothetical protein